MNISKLVLLYILIAMYAIFPIKRRANKTAPTYYADNNIELIAEAIFWPITLVLVAMMAILEVLNGIIERIK